MKLTNKMMWAVCGLAVAGLGLACNAIASSQKRALEEKKALQEFEVLEGEGGICLG